MIRCAEVKRIVSAEMRYRPKREKGRGSKPFVFRRKRFGQFIWCCKPVERRSFAWRPHFVVGWPPLPQPAVECRNETIQRVPERERKSCRFAEVFNQPIQCLSVGQCFDPLRTVSAIMLEHLLYIGAPGFGWMQNKDHVTPVFVVRPHAFDIMRYGKRNKNAERAILCSTVS